MPMLSAPSWHAALTAANVAFIPDGSISKNQQELFRQAKRIRDVKARYENPNVWADYLASLSVERDPNNRSQYAALLQLYQTAVKLVPLSGSNRLSADYLGLWLGLAKLQEEVSLDEARETYKNLRYNGIGKYYPNHHESLAAFEERCGNHERAEKHREDARRIREYNSGKPRKRPAAPKSSSPDSVKCAESTDKSSSSGASSKCDQPSIETESRRSPSPKCDEIDSMRKLTTAPLRPSGEEQPKRANKFVPRRAALVRKPTSKIPTRPLSAKPAATESHVPKKHSPPAAQKSLSGEGRVPTKRSPLSNLRQEEVNRIREEKPCTPPIPKATFKEQENNPPPPHVSPLVSSVSPQPQSSAVRSPPEVKPAARATARQRAATSTRRGREPLQSPQAPTRDPRRCVTVNGRSYEILSQVGKGGSSKVYKVLSSENEVLALKRVVVSPDNHAAMESYGSEIAHLKRLKGEPTIVQLRDAEVSPKTGTILLVLELGDIDLASLLRREKGRHIASDVLRNYWRQMLSAVSTIHAAKIVHGDLKPANFVSVSGTLKLIDFGIAKAITADDTTKITRDSLAGTPNYMSPEALKDIDEEEETGRREYRVGRASDIWSLGCILYQMVYGKTPFAHIRDTFRKTIRIKDPSYEITFKHTGNTALDDVLRGCLQRDPAKRLTMEQLKAHPFLHDGASVNVLELLSALKSRGYDLQLLDRVTRVPLSQHKVKQELEMCCSMPTKLPTRTAAEVARCAGNAHTPSVSAVTKASKVGTAGSFANTGSISTVAGGVKHV